MRFSLANMAHRPSKRSITITAVRSTKTQADDLARIYLKLIAAWQAALPRISALYEANAPRPITTDAPDGVGGAIDEIAAEIDRLILTLVPDLRDWAIRVERVTRGSWIRSVLSATDIDLTTLLTGSSETETVEAALNWNTALIRDVSQQIRQRVANSVFAGFQRRAPAREIAKELVEAIGLGRKRSLLIARDQTVKLASRLDQARQEQAGITKFKWRHSYKRHPRAYHLAHNGKVYDWGKNDLNGDYPGVAPYCGCVAQAHITFD
jgi:SPP1 gp7 family putative phage head morphogenesis protein